LLLVISVILIPSRAQFARSFPAPHLPPSRRAPQSRLRGHSCNRLLHVSIFPHLSNAVQPLSSWPEQQRSTPAPSICASPHRGVTSSASPHSSSIRRARRAPSQPCRVSKPAIDARLCFRVAGTQSFSPRQSPCLTVTGTPRGNRSQDLVCSEFPDIC
jgi:hypothetical protein